VAILLMVIDGYSICAYWWLLMVVVLMTIGGYFINNYWWIFLLINRRPIQMQA
jgi:hypothetical protein